jgi:DNA-binding Lrp family transcriptional regulator
MITAIILLKVERARVNDIAEKISGLDGIFEVYSVSGRYDLVAVARVRGNEALAELVTRHMLQIPGITHSETLFAFRAFSRHDLEGIFTVGFS